MANVFPFFIRFKSENAKAMFYDSIPSGIFHYIHHLNIASKEKKFIEFNTQKLIKAFDTTGLDGEVKRIIMFELENNRLIEKFRTIVAIIEKHCYLTIPDVHKATVQGYNDGEELHSRQ